MNEEPATSKIMCPECQSQRLTPDRIDLLMSERTLAFNPPYYDSEGRLRSHDTNHTTENLRCSNGHTFTKVIPPRNTAITWNASVPTNTTVKVETSTPRQDALWEIVKELSESNGTPSGSMGQRCFSCNALDDSLSNLRHKDTCLIARAYKLVWEKENREQA